jgi:tetratricopeptide (TPR) repeat protein
VIDRRCFSTISLSLLVLFAGVLLSSCKDSPPPRAKTKPKTVAKAAELTKGAITKNNHGVGLMGRFDYAPAVDVFAQLVKEFPGNLDFKVNLAIATLNRQQSADLAEASKILDQVLQADPKHVRANYCLGLIKLFNKGPEGALKNFQPVAAADPSDPYVAYFMGQCHAQMDQHEKALTAYQQAIAADAYLRSAYYGAFMAQQRLGKPQEGKPLLDEFQRLASNPQSRLAEFKYTRMGPKAMAIAIDLPKPPRQPLPQGQSFADAVPLNISPANFAWPKFVDNDRSPSITACDIDGDGTRDLFISGGSSANGSASIVLLRNGDAWRADTEHPLAQVSDVNAVLWGDYDNDGLVDAYLCLRGPNQLWQQTEPGKWQDVTEETKTAGGASDTVDGAMVDADHDGDLDLFLVNVDGPNELLSNDRDGGFRPLAADHGIAGDGGPSRQVVFSDLDGDRDADIIVLHSEPPHEVYLNDRSWSWREADGCDDFKKAQLTAAVAADANSDGQMELYTLGPKGLDVWQPNKKGQWQSASAVALLDLDPAHARLGIADVDGDAVPDAVIGDSAGWRAVRLEKPFDTIYRADSSGPLAATQLILFGASGPEVLALASEGPPLLWAAGKARHPFVTIVLTGKEASSDQMRSNRSGIGVRLAGRADSLWTSADTYRASSGPGQSTPLVALGTGGHGSLDFVSLLWPDGLLQSELDLKPGKLHEIPEVQRQVSSCPVLFLWNGERYEFITDLLGVGGLGFAVGDGSYVPATPRENLLLPQGVMQSVGDSYRLKLLEPMEEACYLDSVQLAYYDLPPGWSMTLDERCSTGQPAATGEPRFYRRTMLPMRAINDRGDDVTRLVHNADNEPAPPGKRDPRFIGRTAQHSVTLHFSESLGEQPGQPLLIANGWVEYPYSQTMFAAWQAGARYESPTIEAQDAAGRWHVLLSQVGYPGGMRRQMSVPLPALPKGCRAIRIRTNLELYWDRLAIAWSEPCPQPGRRTLPKKSAELTHAGFPKRTDGPMRQVDFDYARRAPSADMRFQRGLYSEYGRIEPLLVEIDDAVAIFGPGEEISLDFRAETDRVPEGWTRQFVLETTGWCKDMDLYTQHGETIEPLPTRSTTGESNTGRADLHQHFNTRFMTGE